MVSTTDDAADNDFSVGELSLREAIAFASNVAGNNAITFSSLFNTPQVIDLGSQLPTITEDVTITGPGQDLLTLDAGLGGDGLMNGNGYRIFLIDDGNFNTAIDVEISGLTLTGGDPLCSGGAIFSLENLNLVSSRVSGNSGDCGGGGIFNGGTATVASSTISNNYGGNGGGIQNDFNGATLTVLSSTISGNTASSSGGGIENLGTVTVIDSKISENSADGYGGGIRSLLGTVTITGSTISGNTATRTGGGIRNNRTITITSSTISGNSAEREGGGIFNYGYATISDSTISGNSAIDDGGGIYNSRREATVTNTTISGNSTGGIGGGVFSRGLVTLTNSIVANNPSGGDVAGAFPGAITGSSNLIEDGTGGIADTITGDPLLGPLAFNGGPTQTHALLPGSPAIDVGISTTLTDQRGGPRVVDLSEVANGANSNGADIGAFELQATEPFVAPPVVVAFARDEGFVLERPDLLNTISVSFGVDVSVSAGDLEIRNDTLGGSVVDSSNLIFSYDSTRNTATWDFSSLLLDAAFYSFELSDGIVSVVDGLSLDGDGDGTPGGEFLESVYVAVPGDANLDGQVDVLNDGFALVSDLGANGGASWARGDFNDDGNVDVLGDAFILVSRLGQSVVPPADASAFASESGFSASSAKIKVDATEPVIVSRDDSFAGFAADKRDDQQRSTQRASVQELALVGSQSLDDVFADRFWI